MRHHHSDAAHHSPGAEHCCAVCTSPAEQCKTAGSCPAASDGGNIAVLKMLLQFHMCGVAHLALLMHPRCFAIAILEMDPESCSLWLRQHCSHKMREFTSDCIPQLLSSLKQQAPDLRKAWPVCSRTLTPPCVMREPAAAAGLQIQQWQARRLQLGRSARYSS